ncbi:hypothetical protein [Spongiimicrobium salis]|uniref:hypothetical protein n=1 Tax=Spongiimicrobium salis TaxID=1667022 RepID=UPI00374CA463
MNKIVHLAGYSYLMNGIFKEIQYFRQWWLWLILLGIGIIPTLGIYKQFVLGETFGSHPMSNIGLLVFACIVYGFIGLFWCMRLRTEINSSGIHFEFLPFVRKSILWEHVEKAELIDYGFVGGWGIRWPTAYGTVYNVKGRKGLAIQLKTGKKMVIGTQKEKELLVFMEHFYSNTLNK